MSRGITATSDDMPPQALDQGRCAFSTRSRELASDFLTRLYGPDQQIRFFHGHGADFQMRFAATKVARLRVVKVEVESLECERTAEGAVQIIVPTSGELVVSNGASDAVVADADTAAVVRPFRTTRQQSHSGSAFVLTLPFDALQREVREVSGDRLSGSELLPEITAKIDLTAPLGAALARSIRASFGEIQNLRLVGMHHLADRAFERQLLALAAAVLFPSLARSIEGPRPPPAPDEIGHARKYIIEHALEPIRLASLASRLGLKPRALQTAFRACYGMSPRDFLITCRLQLARQQLLAGRRLVTEVAYASGFCDLSHFASSYRKEYGELPSETLRRARSPDGGRALPARQS